jgi:ribokinase
MSSAASTDADNDSLGSRHGVTIVGSANMDIVFAVERIPRPGETLLADSAARYPGGKGLNQAIAAARAGASTVFIGAIGDDDSGRALEATMHGATIDTRLVRTAPPGHASGQAFIVVDGSGENTIIVASGANTTVTDLTAEDRSRLERSSVVLMQLELPLGTVLAAATVAHSAGAIVMLNAAPATLIGRELLDQLDVLIVNEHEARIIGCSEDLAAASATLANSVDRLVVTLGSKGSVLYEHGFEVARIAAPKVEALDTTGAGDTFCGAFAAAIDEGRGFTDAATFASVAAALSVLVLGAVPSVPQRAAIEAAAAAWGIDPVARA